MFRPECAFLLIHETAFSLNRLIAVTPSKE